MRLCNLKLPRVIPKNRAGRLSKRLLRRPTLLAMDAGYQILKAGGSAVDAAIAIQMVLTWLSRNQVVLAAVRFYCIGMVNR